MTPDSDAWHLSLATHKEREIRCPDNSFSERSRLKGDKSQVDYCSWVHINSSDLELCVELLVLKRRLCDHWPKRLGLDKRIQFMVNNFRDNFDD